MSADEVLATPLQFLKGVGPKRAADLEKIYGKFGAVDPRRLERLTITSIASFAFPISVGVTTSPRRIPSS